MKISISRKLRNKLRREAGRSGAPDCFDALFAEAVARRWFLRMRAPCWRTDEKPNADRRYSLLFRNGRKAIVLPSDQRGISFDRMAKAECDYLIIVELSDSHSGTVKGFLYSFDIRRPGRLNYRYKIADLEPRGMEHFPELLNRPDRFRFTYLLCSLRLLIQGNFRTPPPLENSHY
ncbi:MAG: hypothetical protein KAW14_02900 [Candidatus Aegiribacteria sp.]|nr:hypothetical protein [Candidatus Aegiribacteria sp.]